MCVVVVNTRKHTHRFNPAKSQHARAPLSVNCFIRISVHIYSIYSRKGVGVGIPATPLTYDATDFSKKKLTYFPPIRVRTRGVGVIEYNIQCGG